MSLLGRLKDLVRANLNDVVDRAEDPEKSLNLYIEDASEHVRQFSVEVNRYVAETIMIQDRIKNTQGLIADWHEKAKLALSQNREDLARQALDREQSETEKLGKLKSELTEAEATSAEMKEQQRLLQAKLAEAKEKRDDLIRRNRRAVAAREASNALSGINTEDPLSKFERMQEKVESREAQAKASYAGMTNTLESEFDKLKQSSGDLAVDDALARLKEEMNRDK